MKQRMLSEKRGKMLLFLVLIGVLQSACFIALVAQAQNLFTAGSFAYTSQDLLLGVVAILLLASGRYLERYIAEDMAQGYICGLRKQVFEHTLSLPVTDRELVNKGGTLLRLTSDMSAIRNWIVQGLAPLIVILIWIGGALIGLLQYHPWLVAAVLLPLCVVVWGNYILGRYLYRATEKVRRQRSIMIRTAGEKLKHFLLIKLFNQYGKEKRRFNRRANRLVRTQLSKARASALLRGFNEAALLLTVLSLMLVGFNLAETGRLDIATLPLILAAALYALSDLRRLSRLYELWTFRAVAMDKLERFLARDTEPQKGRKKLRRGSPLLQLKQLSVPSRFAPLNGQVEIGSRVLLRGEQGSGKSSVLKAIAGILPVAKRQLYYSGLDRTRSHPTRWSQNVVYVGPDLPLSRDTLEGNLLYGARQLDDTYYQSVLKLTGLDLVEESMLPEFPVAEGGANLACGLEYRIRLARALLRRPKVLLLDSEPAHQDSDIQRMLSRLFLDFEGAIIITADLPYLRPLLTERWDLVAEHTPGSNNKDNVLPFSLAAKGGQHVT